VAGPPEAPGAQAVSVRVVGVSHAFDGEPVLSGLDLEVLPGEVLALLGPSGCGKTTLLRVLAGLLRPSEGTVRLGDHLVTGPDRFVEPERRGVGMVFQDWALFPHLDVAGNVGFALARPERRDGTAVEEMLDLVGLAGLGRRRPDELSGGQQQRVAIGRALAPHPSVLLLDEPFSNLDSALRARVRGEVRDLVRRVGVTTVLVTHDRAEAYALGDRVAVMRDGRIVQVGTPGQVHAEPADEWVARFVGEVNLLDGQADGHEATTGVGTVLLRRPAHGEVRVVVRPEQLVVAPPTGAPGESPATVTATEFRGDATRVVLDVGGSRVVALVLGAAPWGPGDHVGVTCPASLWALSHQSRTLS